ncbi:MAG: hypothetical protein OXU23_07190 [Candidatus Poribacteria bacterium]|nr:hypothetical protein [Candidatus Poribacteria bacterium]
MSDITMNGHQINAVNAILALSTPIPIMRGVQDFDKLYHPQTDIILESPTILC